MTGLYDRAAQYVEERGGLEKLVADNAEAPAFADFIAEGDRNQDRFQKFLGCLLQAYTDCITSDKCEKWERKGKLENLESILQGDLTSKPVGDAESYHYLFRHLMDHKSYPDLPLLPEDSEKLSNSFGMYLADSMGTMRSPRWQMKVLVETVTRHEATPFPDLTVAIVGATQSPDYLFHSSVCRKRLGEIRAALSTDLDSADKAKLEAEREQLREEAHSIGRPSFLFGNVLEFNNDCGYLDAESAKQYRHQADIVLDCNVSSAAPEAPLEMPALYAQLVKSNGFIIANNSYDFGMLTDSHGLGHADFHQQLGQKIITGDYHSDLLIVQQQAPCDTAVIDSIMERANSRRYSSY